MCEVCSDYEAGQLNLKESLKILKNKKDSMDEAHYEMIYNKIYNDYLQQQLDEFWEITGFGD